MDFSDLGIRVKIGLKRYGTICPNCDKTREKHQGAKCLTVNDEAGNRWYKCNHCGWSGNLDIMDKFDKVQKEAKMPSKERRFTMVAKEYLQSRGISVKTAKDLKIYEDTKFDKTRLCFPYYQNHTLVNVKYLNIHWKPTDKYPKWLQMNRDLGTKAIPFGMQNIDLYDAEGNEIKPLEVIITEGEWDQLTWVELGYKNAISVPQGAPSLKAKNFEKEFSYLQDPYVKSILDKVDKFILSVDNDEPGKNLAKHLGMILGKEKCRIIQYPKGYKDINEVYNGDEKKGLKPLKAEGVAVCYKNLTSFPVAGIIKAHQVYDDLMKIRDKGFEPGLKCGTEEVDNLFTLKRKLCAFVTGIPGCFAGDQLIHTKKGVVPISEIKEGDSVISYNHERKINEFKRVLITHEYKKTPEKLLKITLKDGTVIKATENHMFFNGMRYVKIKEILLSCNKNVLWKNGK